MESISIQNIAIMLHWTIGRFVAAFSAITLMGLTITAAIIIYSFTSGAGMVLPFYEHDLLWVHLLITILNASLLMAALISIVSSFSTFLATMIDITKEGVYLRRGLFRQRTQLIPCGTISSIYISRGFLQQLFGTGSLLVQVESWSVVELAHLDYDAIKGMHADLVRASAGAAASDALSAMDELPQSIHNDEVEKSPAFEFFWRYLAGNNS